MSNLFISKHLRGDIQLLARRLLPTGANELRAAVLAA